MNINPDFQSDSELDAETAMETCMAGIAGTLIEPAMEKGELDETDQELLAVIGTTLKIMLKRQKLTRNFKASKREIISEQSLTNLNNSTILYL